MLTVNCEQIAKIVLMDEVMKWLRQSIKDSLIRIMMASGGAACQDRQLCVCFWVELKCGGNSIFPHTNGLCVLYTLVSMRGRTDNDNAFIVHYCVYVVVLI